MKTDTADNESFQLVHLEINNIKRIAAVEIDADTGAPVILTGDNAQGKSSILDSIEMLLSNKGLPDPVRHGTGKGEITGILRSSSGDLRVVRKFKEGNSTGSLAIYDGKNKQITSAQTFLDSLVGRIAFDPIEFVQSKPKDQATRLREALGLDFSDIDTEAKAAFDERTMVNRDHKQLEGELAGLPNVPVGTPDVEMSATTLTDKLLALKGTVDAAARASRAAEDAQRDKDSVVKRMDTARAEIERLEVLLSDLDGLLDQETKHLETRLLESQKAVAVAKDSSAEIEKIQLQIEDLAGTNKLVATKRRKAELRDKIAAKAKESNELTKTIDSAKARKDELLRKANCPIAGLEFGDDGVTINGVMLEQMSMGEQVRIAASIAMLANPRLRIILVREGALMNKANIKAICDFAKSNGWVVWMEIFREEPTAEGLHIVDGSIAYVDGRSVNGAPVLPSTPIKQAPARAIKVANTVSIISDDEEI